MAAMILRSRAVDATESVAAQPCYSPTLRLAKPLATLSQGSSASGSNCQVGKPTVSALILIPAETPFDNSPVQLDT